MITKVSQDAQLLRREGKEKSYKFKETMGHKLLNTSYISLLNRFGIK